MVKRLKSFLLRLDESPGCHRGVGRLLLVLGLLLYLGVQGVLAIVPLKNWTLLPEADDTLTYVLKTKQMEECFLQNCPALNDLRRQLTAPSPDPEVERQRFLAFSRTFPVYHPLFSLLLLGLSALGPGLMGAYKLLWCLGPLIFGGAFGYLLVMLFGVPSAGLALGLLAFKVFPDTGLHHLVPSNLAMALAVVVWARIIQRQGETPWSLSLGALALVLLHPIGRIYSVMAAVLTLILTGGKPRYRIWVALVVVGILVTLAFILGAVVSSPCLAIYQPPRNHTLSGTILAIGQSLQQVVVDMVRFSGGLFGSWPVFCGAVVLGMVTCSQWTRLVVWQLLIVNGVFLALIFGYVSSHPADIFFRMWIPLLVVLFGLVGQGLWDALARSGRFLLDLLKERGDDDRPLWPRCWPVVLLAVLLGYCLQMMVLGGEQVVATMEFVRQRQPLSLVPEQPALLLSHAKPGDRVLYNSIIIMPYYFIHGAMRLGAVYYHPAFQNMEQTREWLSRPDLCFAVTYNPLVYHPSFEGVDEHRWWITSPEFRFSPLSRRRLQRPLAEEGKLAVARFRWLEVEPQTPVFPKVLRVEVANPGKAGELNVFPVNQRGPSGPLQRLVVPVPADWSGWLEINLEAFPQGRRFRLEFPGGHDSLTIGGLVFGADRLQWPWAQKAKLTLLPRENGSEAITVNFDPSDLLPNPLKHRKITTLNDLGSSVLFHLQKE